VYADERGLRVGAFKGRAAELENLTKEEKRRMEDAIVDIVKEGMANDDGGPERELKVDKGRKQKKKMKTPGRSQKTRKRTDDLGNMY
jgi:hypothetical protein